MVVKITSLEGNGRQVTSSSRPKIEAVYFCIVQMELRVGGNQGDEKQLIDLEWPNSHTPPQRSSENGFFNLNEILRL